MNTQKKEVNCECAICNLETLCESGNPAWVNAYDVKEAICEVEMIEVNLAVEDLSVLGGRNPEKILDDLLAEDAQSIYETSEENLNLAIEYILESQEFNEIRGTTEQTPLCPNRISCTACPIITQGIEAVLFDDLLEPYVQKNYHLRQRNGIAMKNIPLPEGVTVSGAYHPHLRKIQKLCHFQISFTLNRNYLTIKLKNKNKKAQLIFVDKQRLTDNRKSRFDLGSIIAFGRFQRNNCNQIVACDTDFVFEEC